MMIINIYKPHVNRNYTYKKTTNNQNPTTAKSPSFGEYSHVVTKLSQGASIASIGDLYEKQAKNLIETMKNILERKKASCKVRDEIIEYLSVLGRKNDFAEKCMGIAKLHNSGIFEHLELDDIKLIMGTELEAGLFRRNTSTLCQKTNEELKQMGRKEIIAILTDSSKPSPIEEHLIRVEALRNAPKKAAQHQNITPVLTAPHLSEGIEQLEKHGSIKQRLTDPQEKHFIISALNLHSPSKDVFDRNITFLSSLKPHVIEELSTQKIIECLTTTEGYFDGAPDLLNNCSDPKQLTRLINVFLKSQNA